MTKLKPTICAVLLTISISSTALAGNIYVGKSLNGNTPSAQGNIYVGKSLNGNTPSVQGNIYVGKSLTGNTHTRSGIIPTRFDFSESFGRMFQLLLDSGVLF